MDNIRYILFDCMETLVDLKRLPNIRDYAFWGYDGSGVEDLWKDFDEYFQFYMLARADISSRLHLNQEYDMYERFFHLAKLSFLDMPFSRMENVAGSLNINYWKNYRTECYVKEDVFSVLPKLALKYRLGVVSNFMVRDGIEELLEINGIIKFFDFVVTSVKEGWRKPHPAIYGFALDKLGASPGETIFVGDDFVNDYVTPEELGMKPIFLDRYERHPEIAARVTDFYQLEKLLL